MKLYVIGAMALLVFLVACGGSASTATAVPDTAVSPTAISAAAPAASGPATLEIRVTDAPPEGGSKIEITVGSVEVNRAEGPSPVGWETVVSEPQTFDLVQVTGVEAILGSGQLEPGRYNQIRLNIEKAVITIDEEEKAASVPSGRLRLVGTFVLVAGETTIVTLDFDAAKSVVLRGNMDPLLKPVVRLLVRQSDEPFSAALPATAPAGSETVEATQAPLSANTVRVFVPTADNLQFMSFWVALGAGFFDDEGLDVRVQLPPMPGGGTQFLFEDRADVGVFPPPQYLGLIEHQQPCLYSPICSRTTQST